MSFSTYSTVRSVGSCSGSRGRPWCLPHGVVASSLSRTAASMTNDSMRYAFRTRLADRPQRCRSANHSPTRIGVKDVRCKSPKPISRPLAEFAIKDTALEQVLLRGSRSDDWSVTPRQDSPTDRVPPVDPTVAPEHRGWRHRSRCRHRRVLRATARFLRSSRMVTAWRTLEPPSSENGRDEDVGDLPPGLTPNNGGDKSPTAAWKDALRVGAGLRNVPPDALRAWCPRRRRTFSEQRQWCISG